MKTCLGDCFIILLLVLFCFYIYSFISIPVLRIFFATNNSIFSILKATFSAYIIFLIFSKRKDKYIQILIKFFSCIIFFIAFYLIMTYLLKINLFITFIILFISILSSQIITCRIKKYSNKLNYLSIISIFVIYFIFLYFTDFPLKNFLFK